MHYGWIRSTSFFGVSKESELWLSNVRKYNLLSFIKNFPDVLQLFKVFKGFYIFLQTTKMLLKTFSKKNNLGKNIGMNE